MQHAARPLKEQPFEQAVIERVQERTCIAERGQGGVAMVLAEKADANAECDDADVLHTVIGEQALEVVLSQRMQHSRHARDRADQDQDRAPPRGRRP